MSEMPAPEPPELTPEQLLARMYPGVEWTPEEVDCLVKSGLI